VRSPRLPAGGATKILLEANLVLKYSSGERTIEQKNVDLNMDKITAAPVPMMIARQQDPGFMVQRVPGMPAGTQVALFYQGNLIGLKKIAFVDADGNEIQATNAGGGSNGWLYQTYYRLARNVETCTLRITIPEKIETATVAVSVTTGVGFAAGVRRSLVPAPRQEATSGNAVPK
jgi:hypothetical protein